MNAAKLPLALCTLLVVACTVALAAETKDPAAAMRTKLSKVALGPTLGEALTRLEKLAGTSFEPDWLVLGDMGLGKDTKVALEGADSTAGQVLDALLLKVAPAGKSLTWYVEKDAVHVTSQTRAAARLRASAKPAEDDAPPAKPSRSSAPRRKAGETTLDFDELPLSDVIEFFRASSGLNFHVQWKALELAGIAKDAPITLKATNISLGKALSMVLDQLNADKQRDNSVYWVVDDGVVLISTGAGLNQKLITRTFDVADLLVYVPDFRSPRINFDQMNNNQNQSGTGQGGGFGGGGGGGNNGDGMFREDDQKNDRKSDDRTEHRKAIRDTLISTIKESIGEDMWQPNGKGSIKMLGSRMIVSQTLLGFKLLEESSVLK